MFDMSVAALGRALRDGSLSPVGLAESALQRIAALDGQVRAFVTVTKERALEDARRAEQELRAGLDRGPLHGLPLVLKDLVANAQGLPRRGHALASRAGPPIGRQQTDRLGMGHAKAKPKPAHQRKLVAL
jgi:aspartyl-tRNA(Asn)/glutamyl-tRNA(Gln) amidotransferase subunit A